MGIGISRLFAFLVLAVTLSPSFASQIRLGLFNSIDSLDPAYCTGTTCLIILNGTNTSLIEVGTNNEILPSGASSWHLDEQQLTYTFSLRRDATWSDGLPVTAKDYVAAFQRIADNTLAQYDKPTYLLLNIDNALDIIDGLLPPEALGIEAIDDWTLEIRLSSPASYFLHILASPSLSPVPTHVIEKKGNAWSQQIPLVSNGPFQITDVAENHFTLSARSDHWFKPASNSLSIRILETESIVFELLANNKLDLAFSSGTDVENWKITQGFTEWAENALPSTAFLSVNVARQPLSDRRVRQAIHLLIDRDRIASALSAIPATSIVPRTFTGEIDFAEDWRLHSDYEARLLEARDLLSQAGYTDKSPLELTLMYMGAQSNEAVFNGLRSMLSTANIQLVKKVTPGESFITALNEADWDLSLIYWGADYPDPMSFFSIAQSDHSWNKGGWSNQAYDTLIETSLNTIELSERHNLYKQLNSTLAREMVVIPLFYDVSFMFYNALLEKPNINMMGNFIRDLALKPTN